VKMAEVMNLDMETGDANTEDVVESGDSEGEELSQAATSKAKGKFPCLKCQKSVKAGVRCNTCHLWVHTKCQGISKELVAILKNPGKFGGSVCWNCDSCQASAVRLEARMTALEKSHREVEERMLRTEGTVQQAVQRVDKVETRQDKVEDMLAKERERARVERVVEMRERDLRKKNVLVHRMEEAGEWAKTANERRTWDMDSCGNMFKELRMDWNKEAIRFCRRIGEKGEEPRPMVVGLNREAQKEELLDRAKDLQNTVFANIGIVPDLTQEQRKDEADMAKEADRRNMDRSEDEWAKNLIWKVLGRRGEKRLVKVVEREGEAEGAREGVRTQLLLPRRGRGQWVPGVVRGGAGRGGAMGVGLRGGGGAQGDREQLLELVRAGGAETRPRMNSKRTREGEEEEERVQPAPPSSQMAR